MASRSFSRPCPSDGSPVSEAKPMRDRPANALQDEPHPDVLGNPVPKSFHRVLAVRELVHNALAHTVHQALW